MTKDEVKAALLDLYNQAKTAQMSEEDFATHMADILSNNTADALTHFYAKDLNYIYWDYIFFVVPVLKITASIDDNRFCYGKLYSKRSNGIYPAMVIDFKASKAYSASPDTLFYHSESITNNGAWKPCTFNYNGEKYFGYAWYASPASLNKLLFEGYSSDITFMQWIRYYNVLTHEILNSEIYNSLSFIDTIDPNQQIEYLYKNINVLGNLFYKGDYIIESGSNSNGQYIKFAGGTMIQRGLSSNLDQTGTPGYYSVLDHFFDFTCYFPVAFISDDYNILATKLNVGINNDAIIGQGVNDSNEHGRVFGYFTPTAPSTVTWFAIGRWKA